MVIWDAVIGDARLNLLRFTYSILPARVLKLTKIASKRIGTNSTKF